MIEIARQERIAGDPMLTPKTAKAALLVKFLGSTAAHTQYAGVHLESLATAAPQIKTAIDELSRCL